MSASAPKQQKSRTESANYSPALLATFVLLQFNRTQQNRSEQLNSPAQESSMRAMLPPAELDFDLEQKKFLGSPKWFTIGPIFETKCIFLQIAVSGAKSVGQYIP